jgi:hypothetical protein
MGQEGRCLERGGGVGRLLRGPPRGEGVCRKGGVHGGCGVAGGGGGSSWRRGGARHWLEQGPVF